MPNQDLAVFLEYLCDKIIKQKTNAKRTSTAIVAAKSQIQGCCQHKSPITGKICGNKWFPQVDHRQSKWAGGSDDIENLQNLCAQHNNLKYKKEAGIAYRS